MGNGALAYGPKLPRPSSTLPEMLWGERRCQIKVVESAWVDHLDAYSAPRLVENFDPDPCHGPNRLEMVGGRARSRAWRSGMEGRPHATYYNSLVREQLGRYRGREIDTAGDAFF